MPTLNPLNILLNMHAPCGPAIMRRRNTLDIFVAAPLALAALALAPSNAYAATLDVDATGLLTGANGVEIHLRPCARVKHGQGRSPARRRSGAEACR